MVEYVGRTYNPYLDERIAANYYPCSSQSYFSDSEDSVRFSTIVNQAHGVGSTFDGGYELMLQRRCLSDDSRGVGEVLNTSDHTEPELYVMMDDAQEVAFLNRRLNLLQQFDTSRFYALTNSMQTWSSMYRTNRTFMAQGPYYQEGLPRNIHLFTMRYGYSGSGEESTGLVYQLQNMFQVNESTTYSVPVTVNVSSIIDPSIVMVTNMTEMTLVANLPLADLHRLPWNVQDKDGKVRRVNTGEEIHARLKSVTANSVTINPRQIRTFVINEDVSVREGYPRKYKQVDTRQSRKLKK
jgi:hypothetical protein